MPTNSHPLTAEQTKFLHYFTGDWEMAPYGEWPYRQGYFANKLCDKGFVERKRHDNGRNWLYRLTNAGRKIISSEQ